MKLLLYTIFSLLRAVTAVCDPEFDLNMAVCQVVTSHFKSVRIVFDNELAAINAYTYVRYWSAFIDNFEFLESCEPNFHTYLICEQILCGCNHTKNVH